ncbi:MAG: cyclic nucleotide-binding domain-containing protein [Polyangiaceae bacterium]|nr:cyclic nucleotide-binding domain-containing protein [Polyangiaceae bacterium]
MSDPRRALLESAFFADAKIDPDSLAEMARALEDRAFKKGERIFREGDPAPDMLFVVRGRVGIFKTVGASRVPLAEIGPGGYFGEIALVDGGARSADADALEDVEALSLADAVFDDLLERAPRLAVFFLKATSRRLRALNRQVTAPEAPKASAAPDPIADRYPHPIAAVYRHMTVLADPRPRLERLLDLLEVTVRYLGLFAVAEYVAGPRSSELLDDLVVKGLGKSSLGQWLMVVRETLLPYGRAPGELFAPELFAARYERPGRPSAAAEALDGLLRFRNDLRHGAGGALSEEAARAALAEHEPVLREVLASLSCLADYPLVWLERMSFSRGSFVYRYQKCMGAHGDFGSAELSLKEPFETGQLFLLHKDGGRLLPLFPFMMLETCAVCTLRDVFLFYDLSNAAGEFVELVRGHHQASAPALEAYGALRTAARERLEHALRTR